MAEVLKIQKWGNSQGIRLPKKILKDLKIDINDKIEIILNGEEIILKKIKNDYYLYDEEKKIGFFVIEDSRNRDKKYIKNIILFYGKYDKILDIRA